MKKIAIYLTMFLFLGISCSEDVKMNPELAGPLYGLTKGEPGSVDELIYNTWEEWGMYYLYKFEPYAFQVSNWSGYFNKWYTPVKEENKEVIRKIIDHIQGEIFVGMDKDLLRGSWFVRTFLCDSLCDDYDYDPEELVDNYLQNGDCIILAGVGERMNNFTDEDWSKWKEALSSLLISRLYLGATEQPDDFFNLRMKNANGKEATAIYANAWEDDPAGRYSPGVYTFRKNGYVRSKPALGSTETILIVARDMDLADYISFLTNTEKTELDYNFEVFPRMLERAVALIPYLQRVLSMDLEAMQNANCPTDPVEADYFKNLTK